jgi:hypothetical protein
MTLDEYMRLVSDSTRSDWNVIVCWGAGSGPSYLTDMSVWYTGSGDFHNLEMRTHSSVATFKQDISVSFAWGMQSNDDFMEDWANKFPDSHASSYYIDFFYHGSLIARELGVSVDGGRVTLPLPDRDIDSRTYETRRLTVTSQMNSILKLINSMTSSYDYDEYLKRAGIVVVT